MTDGTGSTLILRPYGLSSITFNLSGAFPGGSNYTYIADLGRLDFNEEGRWQWVYDQARAGARAVDGRGSLVPVTMSIVIKAISNDYRKEAYRVLQQAVMNRRGGVLQYKPEGAGESTLSTYYHYVAGTPPRLVDAPRNRWDADPDGEDYYVLQVDVELPTQAVATSDPESPETISGLGVTRDNWEYSSTLTNRVTISAGALQGSLPALVRLLAYPTSGTLGRLICFRRSSLDGTLADLVTVYEAEDGSAISPSIAWSEVADADRGAEAYMKCAPAEDANGVGQGLQITLSDAIDSQGRFAVFGVGCDRGPALGVWTHQVRLKAGNVTQTGDADYYATSLDSWQLIYVGEFELPLTDLSDLTEDYDSGPYLEWYSSRASGTSEFWLDGVVLVWVSDALGADGEGTALDVICDDEGGVTSSERLLIENLLHYGRITERAYVTASDYNLKRTLATAPRGDFLTLDPQADHLLVFLRERALQNYSDDFASYKASQWFSVAQFTTAENWYFAATSFLTTDYVVEGSYGLRFQVSSTATDYIVTALDLDNEPRFKSGDYVVAAIYVVNAARISAAYLIFATTYLTDYYRGTVPSLSNGWNYIKIAKAGGFASVGSPDWSDINYFAIQVVPTGGTADITFDYVRIEKADPDDSGYSNPTGDEWNFQPDDGAWAITEDVTADSPGAVLACLDNESGVEKAALYMDSLGSGWRMRARVMAKKSDGKVGVIWLSNLDTLSGGAEDCYAALIDTSANKLYAYEYTNGAATQKDDPAFTADTDKWYTIGVVSKQSSHKIYAALSSGLGYEDDAVFEDDNLLTSFSDSTYTTGRCGVMCASTLGRFDHFVVESSEDKHVPTDQITLSGKAIYRTIAPFD